MNAIEVEHLSFAYSGRRKILDDISFTVEAGQALVLAGLSGCGKSTLCRCLCGLIPKSVSGDFSGRILIQGQNLSRLDLARAATSIGLVFQNPDEQLVCETVEDELAFGPENLGWPPQEIQRQVEAVMEEMGLTTFSGRDPDRLSGGQKKLVTIASVLIMGPQVLVLDEPMTGLDEDSRRLVERAIIRVRESGRTVIAVEHDLAQAGYAQRILYLREGKLYAEA
ncbi:MAG: ABC transporter ATP-binding protein [Firmicutes bacterium]|nr:ABC transporter ATP-binding protein [Bacillota bacterium]MBQ6606313.1 ABC transporter ATP-binding protein [Bacillota bacterium]MBR0179448.1 ABC transporter ATP-binding protein [Bacillota bacterium]